MDSFSRCRSSSVASGTLMILGRRSSIWESQVRGVESTEPLSRMWSPSVATGTPTIPGRRRWGWVYRPFFQDAVTKRGLQNLNDSR